MVGSPYHKFENPQALELAAFVDTCEEALRSKLKPTQYEEYFQEIASIISQQVLQKDTLRINHAWVNTYTKGASNEVHTHEDDFFVETGSTHFLIQVLETGNQPETLNVYSGPDLGKIDIPMSVGDAIIMHRSVPHGLETTVEKLRVLVLGMSFK